MFINRQKFENSTLIGILIIFLGLLIGSTIYKSGDRIGESTSSKPNQNIASTSANFSPIPFPSFQPYFQSSPTPQPVVQNTDPVITCASSYPKCSGQSIQIKQSECPNITCCQVGDKWSVYSSSTKCDQDQKAYNDTQSKTNSGSNNTPTTAYPSYPPCTVYYPALKYSQTYMATSPDTCKSWQDSTNSGSTNTSQSLQTPTSTDQTQSIIDQHNSQVMQCQANVVDKYQGLLQSCTQYGDSSAGEACTQIYQGQRQSEYNACGSAY